MRAAELKIRITQACFAGRVVRRVGETVTLPADEALELLSLGKAEPVNRVEVRSKERVTWEEGEPDARAAERTGWMLRH
jgi:hypothetical protein